MISIITITYNRANLIGDTIQSVLGQTYSNFEYIIVDDGSDDNTEDVIKKFKDDRIRYFKLPKTGYLSKLRNFALKKVTGKHVAFIDSDDLWEKEKLKIQVDILENDISIGFCFCDVLIFRETTILKEKIYNTATIDILYKANMFKEYITSKLSLYPSAIMIRKECFDILGEQDETMQSGDHDFMCRLMFKFKGCAIYRSLSKIRKHDGNHSTLGGILCFDEYIITLNKFYSERLISERIYRTMVSDNHYQAGILYLRNGDYEDAKTKFITSFKINIFNYKGLVRYFMCFLK